MSPVGVAMISRAEFVRRIAGAVYQRELIEGFADQVGLPVGGIAWGDGARVAWSELLYQAQHAKKVEDFVTSVWALVPSLRGERLARSTTRFPDWSPDWDVGRELIEKEALERIEGDSRIPVVLFGASGYGRSWFVSRLVARLNERGRIPFDRVIVLREENFKTDGAATDFFDGLWEGITAQLSPRHRQGLGGGVAADPDGNPAENFRDRIAALANVTRDNLCILFDVPDTIWELPPEVRNGFFAQIRAWKHAVGESFRRLRCVVAFSLTPPEMHDDPRQSNLAPDPFELRGFSAGEVRALAVLYDVPWTNDEIAAVQATLGGHPQYVRRVLDACAKGEAVVPLLADCHLAGRPFHGVLLDLRERLRVRASLWDAFVGVARENKAPRSSADYRALLSAGLIRSDDNVRYELRFDLLHRILGLPG